MSYHQRVTRIARVLTREGVATGAAARRLAERIVHRMTVSQLCS